MTNPRSAHFEMKGLNLQISLRRGRGRSWLEILADYYASPDPGFWPEAKAYGLHGSWGWNLWTNNSTALFAKAGMGIAWFKKFPGARVVETLLLWGAGTGVEKLLTHGWGVRLEGRIESGALYLTRTGHVMPSWIVISLGLVKQF